MIDVCLVTFPLGDRLYSSYTASSCVALERQEFQGYSRAAFVHGCHATPVLEILKLGKPVSQVYATASYSCRASHFTVPTVDAKKKNGRHKLQSNADINAWNEIHSTEYKRLLETESILSRYDHQSTTPPYRQPALTVNRAAPVGRVAPARIDTQIHIIKHRVLEQECHCVCNFFRLGQTVGKDGACLEFLDKVWLPSVPAVGSTHNTVRTHQRRLDHCRRNSVNADPIGTQKVCKRPAQTEHGRFRRAVRQATSGNGFGDNRGNVDDYTSFFLDTGGEWTQVGVLRVDGVGNARVDQECTIGVDVQDLLECLSYQYTVLHAAFITHLEAVGQLVGPLASWSNRRAMNNTP